MDNFLSHRFFPHINLIYNQLLLCTIIGLFVIDGTWSSTISLFVQDLIQLKNARCASLKHAGMDMKQINLALNYHSMRKSYMKKAFSIFAHRYAPSKFLADTFAKFGFSDIEVTPLGAIFLAAMSQAQDHKKSNKAWLCRSIHSTQRHRYAPSSYSNPR